MANLDYGISKSRAARIVWIALSIALVLLFLGIVGIAIWMDLKTPKEASRSDVQLEAEPIIKALELYRMDNGRYPDKLSTLEPKYIATIPPPPKGATLWEYGASQGRDIQFRLTVKLKQETIDYLTDWPGHWCYRDSSF